MNHVSIIVNLEIRFEHDPKRLDLEQAMLVARSLAINPNYCTIEEGVRLISVQKSEPKFFFQTLNHPKMK